MHVGAEWDGEHVGANLIIGDLAIDDLFIGQATPLFCVTDMWAPAVSRFRIFDFLDLFHRFECMFLKFISQARSVQFW